MKTYILQLTSGKPMKEQWPDEWNKPTRMWGELTFGEVTRTEWLAHAAKLDQLVRNVADRVHLHGYSGPAEPCPKECWIFDSEMIRENLEQNLRNLNPDGLTGLIVVLSTALPDPDFIP